MTDEKQTKQMTIRLPVDVYERARELAEADGMWLSPWVVLALKLVIRFADQQEQSE